MTTKFFSEKAYLYARILTYCLLISLPFTRMFSGLNLVAATLLAWLFLIFHWKRKLIPTSLIFFTVVANFYFILSFLNIFPTIWTKYFVIKAIPQQALFAYSLLPMFYLCFAFTLYYLHSKERLYQLLKIILIFFIYNKIIEALTVGFNPQFFFSIAGLGNTSALAIFACGLAVAVTENVKIKYVYMAIFAAMSFYSPFSQNIIFALLFVWVFIAPKYAFYSMVGFIASTIIFYAAFLSDPMAVRFIDQNLSVRLVLVKDAIDGFIDSNMIGVGYGTESLSNYYFLFKNPTFQNVDEAGFIHITVHNSFATILFRLGLLGGIAFFAFLLQIILSIKASIHNRQTMIVFFLCFYIVSFQNPALESYRYMIGAFIMLGSIWALYFVEKQSGANLVSMAE
ncbi:MAG: hypothetical protein HRT37_13220 [Alteromonadaceae bacterium]|nr:hypothetical protein [Alteromonadaceae bacterium]